MTLEAGKEMDKRCVLNWLNEVYVTPSRAFDEYTEDELKMFAHNAIAMLQEQEEQKQRWLKQIEDAQITVCRTWNETEEGIAKRTGMWNGLQMALDILKN